MELIRKLGQGAVTEVWRARDSQFDRLVAVKRLRPEFVGDPSLNQRFAFEVKRHFALRHDHVISLYSMLREDDAWFLMEEYIEGGNLAQLLAAGHRLDIAEVIRIARDILDALGHAHKQGFVHRGLRPSNIHIRPNGRACLSDFGIGYGLQTVFEEPDFRAPEQIRGAAELDGRADIYSFGRVLEALLPGNAISRRATADERENRYAYCQEVLDDLGTLGLREITGGFRPVPGVPQPAEPYAPPDSPDPLDEDVQFTVYRPQSVPPETWKMMLAFAHRSSRPPDALPDEPDPIAEVERQAQELLGKDIREYRHLTQDTTRAIPRQGVLTLIPEMEGADFQPASQNITWKGRVPPAVFLFSARREFLGRTLRGSLYIYLGNIIVAQVPLGVRVEAAPALAAEPYSAEAARWYRRIFASYSHKDTAIVEEFERHAKAFGDDYLRDLTTLRTGTSWNEELRRMIHSADVFQLFWSDNAMNSPYVRQEYSYALSLRREGFVRPVFWQEPMPMAPGLPPAELERIHFHRIAAPGAEPHPPVDPPPRQRPPEVGGSHHPAEPPHDPPPKAPNLMRWLGLAVLAVAAVVLALHFLR